MVRKAFEVVYKEIRGLHQAAYILALFTIGSQLLALIRDRLLAHQFGAGIELDLYYAAFRIPDLLYVLFASTLSVYVLIPFVSGFLEERHKGKAQHFLSEIYTLFLIAYALLALLIGISAPYFIHLVFPGFVEHQEELVTLMRILLLQPFFLGISSLLGVITQLGHRFVLYAISPLIYNIGIIIGIIAFYPLFGMYGIALGVVLGAVGHVFIQLPFVLASGLAPRLVKRFEWMRIQAVLLTSVPRALTLSLHQIVLLGLIGFASLMAEGSVSVFQFGFNLQSVSLAIIGVSYSVAAFPRLAELYTAGKLDVFAAYLITAMRHIIFWSIPLLALIIVVRAQFVRVILGSGAFDWDDTRLTAAVLALFSLSLLAQAVNLLIVRALYAAGNTRIPFFVTLASSVSMLILTLVLLQLFKVFEPLRLVIELAMRVVDVPGTEVLVLPLAYTLALIFHSIVLLVISAKKLSVDFSLLRAPFSEAMLAGLVGGLAAYTVLNYIVAGLNTETLVGIFLQGFIAGTAGIAAATFAYYLQGSRELKEVYRALCRRVLKRDIVAPQGEDHLSV